MFLSVDVRVRRLQPRATVCWLLLLAYFGVFAHDFAHSHAEADTGCTVCIVADRLNDIAVNSGGGPFSSFMVLPARFPHTRSVTSAEILIAASRDPPAQN